MELKIILLENGLLTCLRCWLLLACGTRQHEALIDVRDEVVVQVLSVVFFDMLAARLICRVHHSGKAHAARHVLTLVDHVTLESLVVRSGAHGLIQDLLHIHRATHLLFLVNGAALCLGPLADALRHFA